MILKRVGSIKNKKNKKCLQCGRLMVGLKDNEVHRCGACGQRIAGMIAVVCIALLAAIVAKENQPEVTAVAPETGKIQTEQDTWGTITVTDDTGVTREYQGCIHISGTYPYETTEYMGLCVSMDSAIVTGEWSPGMYKLYYESEGRYWEAKNDEKENKTDE